MSRHGAVELAWGGGEHTFRLGLAEIEELEAACDMSVFLLYAAMGTDLPFARMKHYSETIRLGLIGGGMKPIDARVLVRRYVDERPLAESVAVGQAVLRAALERVHSDEVDRPSGEAAAPKTSGGSTSGPSTETPSSWESETSDRFRSDSGSQSAANGTKRTGKKPSRPRPSKSSKRQ